MNDSAFEFLEEFLTSYETRNADRLNGPWYLEEDFKKMSDEMILELKERRTDIGMGYAFQLRSAMKRVYDAFQGKMGFDAVMQESRNKRRRERGATEITVEHNIPSWDWIQDYDRRSAPKYKNYNGPFVYVADKSGQAPGFRLVDKAGKDWPRYPSEAHIAGDERFSKTNDSLPGERAGYRMSGATFKGMHFHLFFEGGVMQLKTEEATESAPHSGGSHLDRVGAMNYKGGYSISGVAAHNITEVNIQNLLDNNRVQEVLSLGSPTLFKKILSDLREFLAKGDLSQWKAQINAFIGNVSSKLMVGLKGSHKTTVSGLLAKVSDITNSYDPKQSGSKIAEVIRDIDGMA